MLATKEDIISKLRQDIASWEGFRPPQPGTATEFGLGMLEKAFPNQVFPTGAIHEFVSQCPEDTSAGGAFIAGIANKLVKGGGACIWISWTRRIYPPALKIFGLDPDKVIFIDVPLQRDLLWVTEEALKCDGVSVVVCETDRLDFAASQRLQLAVEKSRTTGFILRKNAIRQTTTACAARWKVTALPSELRPGMPGVGRPRWLVELQKVRNGSPGSWIVEWRRQRFQTILPEKATERSRQYA